MMQTNKIKRFKIIFLSLLALVLALSFVISDTKTEATSSVVVGHRSEGSEQAQDKQEKKKPRHPRSVGCVICHTGNDSMHFDGDEELDIGCVDCHGGDFRETTDKEKAHVQPRFLKPEDTKNHTRLNAVWNKESDEYIRFVNPGDFRAADAACGKCHEREVIWAKKSMMTHGGMLWGAALYNNGAYPMKDANFGESYGKDGQIQGLLTRPAPTI